jgi:hypothetical protein
MVFRVTFAAAAMLILAGQPGLAQGTKYYWGEGEALCNNWTKERQSKSVVGTQMGAWIRLHLRGQRNSDFCQL